MLLQKIKWMAIGVAITGSTVFIYNHRDAFKKLSGSNYNAGVTNKINPEFANFISAFTTGYISSGSTIKIKLANELNSTFELNTPIKEEYITFSPEIEGTLVWKDGQNLEFKPKQRLKDGQIYKATFHLDKLVEVKKDLQDFDFQFQVIKQSIQLESNELKSYNSNDYNYYSLSGNVSTADFAEANNIEQTLSAKLNSKNLNIKWTHNDQGTSHKFLIDSIERPNSGNSKLTLNCNAQALNLPYTSDKSFDVVQKSKFQLLNTRLVNDNEQYVQVTFSNPLDQSQTLEGLIALGTIKDLKYIVANNQVLLYPNEIKSGSHVLIVNEGIRDGKGQIISEKSEHNIVFSEIKPAVRFVGDGNILPSTNSLTIPFETVNLKAVDVKIVRIYENNILQFLQSNDMNGGSNLAQVGKKIIEKRINLGISNPADFSFLTTLS